MTAIEDLCGQIQTLFGQQTEALTAVQSDKDALTRQLNAMSGLVEQQTEQIRDLQAQVATTPKPTPPTLFGVDGQPLDIASFPRVAYCREYSPPGRGIKPLSSPASVTLPHVSFKDPPTPALVNAWLDKLTRPVALEWNHEPEGDMTTATYVAGVTALLQAVAAHPNGHLATVAQTFTRYAQVHGKTMTDGQSASWQNLWVKGSGLIGFDCEVDTSIKGYPDPAALFAPAVAASKALGVPFLIPELGWPQQSDDGTVLAAWYVSCAAYLRSQNCRGVAAFNQQGTTGNYNLTGPAKQAWQSVIASQEATQ